MAKRAPGTGSIIYDKRRKRWIYQYTMKDNDKTHRKAIYAKSRAELEYRIAKIDLSCPFDITTEQWITKWLSVYVKDAVKPNTLVYYRHMLDYLTDEIRNTSLHDLTTLQCQVMLSELRDHGRVKGKGGSLSTSTVRSIRSSFITCLDAAVSVGIIKSNPVKATKPPRLVRKEKVFLTQEQAVRLLEVAEKADYYVDKADADQGQLYLLKCYAVLIRLALVTGMRRGELLGLQWSCVDFENNTISISKQMQYDKKHGFYLATPKTNSSIRTISIDEETMKKLKKWHDYQQNYAETLGNLFVKHELVFTNEFGKFINPDNFRCRHWRAMCRAAELPPGCTLHSLRHTAATFMLSSGIDIKTAAQRLGHSNANTLLKVYAHVLNKNDVKAADILASIISLISLKTKKEE